MKKAIALFLMTLPVLPAGAYAATSGMAIGANLAIEMHKVTKDGIGELIGEMRVLEHSDGVLFEPNLEGLEPGLHGFHLHQNGACEPEKKDGKVTPGGAAGGHFDPQSKGSHNGPYQAGHLGDLPALYVAEDGTATHEVLAPRLRFEQVAGHALVIHQGPDNYSASPEALGGGGPRVACGVVRPD